MAIRGSVEKFYAVGGRWLCMGALTVMYRDGQGTEVNNEKAATGSTKLPCYGTLKIELAELCLSYDCSKLNTQ